MTLTYWSQNTRIAQLDEEFGHIENWALKNKSIISKAETKEWVFRRPHPTKFDMRDALDGIAQERAAKLIGVIFTGKLSFEDHVDFVLTVCSQRVYLLKLLRSQDLPTQQLHMVFMALILSRIRPTNGLPAREGQLMYQIVFYVILVIGPVSRRNKESLSHITFYSISNELPVTSNN